MGRQPAGRAVARHRAERTLPARGATRSVLHRGHGVLEGCMAGSGQARREGRRGSSLATRIEHRHFNPRTSIKSDGSRFTVNAIIFRSLVTLIIEKEVCTITSGGFTTL